MQLFKTRRFGSALALLLALSVVTALPAAASYVSDAAIALKSNPIYVHPDMRPQLSAGDEQALWQRITSGNKPIYVALLPEAALADTGGNADNLPQAIGNLTGPGTVAVVAQLPNGKRGLRASSSLLPTGKAGELATLAVQSKGSSGMAAILTDFISRVQREPDKASQPSSSGSPAATPKPSDDKGGTSGWLIFLLVVGVLTLLGLAVWGLVRRSQRKEEERQEARDFADEKAQAESAVSALANDVLLYSTLTNPRAQELYGQATERYNYASSKLGRATTRGDIAAALEAAQAGQRYMNDAVTINSGGTVKSPEPTPPPNDSSRRQSAKKPKASGSHRGGTKRQRERTDVPPPSGGRKVLRNYRYPNGTRGDAYWYGGGYGPGGGDGPGSVYYGPGYYAGVSPWDTFILWSLLDNSSNEGSWRDGYKEGLHDGREEQSSSDVSVDHGTDQYDRSDTSTYDSPSSDTSYDRGGGADIDPEPERVSVDSGWSSPAPSYNPPAPSYSPPSYDPPSYDSGSGGGYDSGSSGGYDSGGGGGDF
jgi:hypothetical protein